MGMLGAEQLAWLADDVKGLSDSTPIVVFAHIPLWTISMDWGWGTEEDSGASAIDAEAPSVRCDGDYAQWPYSSVDAEDRRKRHLPHRAVDGISPAGKPGTALQRRCLWSVPAEKLRFKVLGIRTVVYTQGQKLLAGYRSTTGGELNPMSGHPTHWFFRSLPKNLWCRVARQPCHRRLGPFVAP